MKGADILNSEGNTQVQPMLAQGKDELELTIDKLFDPVVSIIRHYRGRNFERRALFFTWVANIFKPVAAIEVSKILGYEYRKVDNLFRMLSQSGVLIDVTREPESMRIMPGHIPLYVRNDVFRGRKLSGRPPKMYVFSERESINVEAFVESFNSDSSQVWRCVTAKVLKLGKSLDESYRDALVDDVLFLCERIGPIFRFLTEEGILIIERRGAGTSIKIKLAHGSAKYNIPDLEPFRRIL